MPFSAGLTVATDVGAAHRPAPAGGPQEGRAVTTESQGTTIAGTAGPRPGPRHRPSRWSATGSRCRARTAPSVPTCRWTRRRPPPRCRRCWPGWRSSCPGTPASTAAPATSPRWPPAPTRTRGRPPSPSPGGRPDRGPGDDVAIICRNTTEAINHLAYRLRLTPDDVVVTTVVEHHANLLPWSRARDLPLRRVRPGRHVRRRRRRGGARPAAGAPAARHHRRVEHHRLDAAARRDHRGGARPRRPGGRGRGPAGPAPAAPGRRGLPRLERPQDVRAVRRGRAGRPRPAPSPTGIPSWPAAAPSTSSTSTRCCGPTRPNGRRPARPTWSAPWPCTPRSTR